MKHIQYKWKENDNELDTQLLVGNDIILTIDEKFYRPAEVDLLYGDSFETQKLLRWKPKYSFEDLVKKMVEHDIKLLE